MDGESSLPRSLVEERLLRCQLLDHGHVRAGDLAVLGIGVRVHPFLLHLPESLLELWEVLHSGRVGVLLVDQDRHARSKILECVVPNLHPRLLVVGIRMRLHTALTQPAERLVHTAIVHEKSLELLRVQLGHAERGHLLLHDQPLCVARCDAGHGLAEVSQA